MITIDIYGAPKCIMCTRAMQLSQEYRAAYSDRVRILYHDLDKSSPTYSINMGILTNVLKYRPDHVPVILVNNKETKLSKLEDAIKELL